MSEPLQPGQSLAMSANMSANTSASISANLGTTFSAAIAPRSCPRTFEEESNYLLRVLLNHGVPEIDAEDLVHDVFVIAYRRWDDYQSSRPLRPWLAGIARNLALKHHERRRREIPLLDNDRPDDTPLPDEHLASARARRLVHRVIAQLPTRHRIVLLLHELDGVEAKRLAELWTVGLPTAYTRIRSARQAFAALLGAGRSRS
jgi:RNA polymerase sigma-70 factor, ECF subfamily